MRSLLDTNVLSELRLGGGNAGVKSFVRSLLAAETYLSVLTIGEISKGAERLPDGRKRRDLIAWREELLSGYANRILDIDSDVAQIWGEITARARKEYNFDLPVPDGLIAATAIRHGLHVVTRNTKDFAPTGVFLVNPWEFDIS